ncbi:MAG: hypothetical protein ACOCUQ_01210 [Bacteroidota bacterium]
MTIILTQTRMIGFLSMDKNTKPEFWRATPVRKGRGRHLTYLIKL